MFSSGCDALKDFNFKLKKSLGPQTGCPAFDLAENRQALRLVVTLRIVLPLVLCVRSYLVKFKKVWRTILKFKFKKALKSCYEMRK